VAPDQIAAWILPDTTGPSVERNSPARDAIRIPLKTTIVAEFSEDMDRGSLTNEDPTKTPPPPKTSSTFTLVKVNLDGTKAPIPAEVAYLDRDPNATPSRPYARATLTPQADLDPDTQYIATIQGGSGGATDKFGNPLTRTEVWSFRTSDGIAPTVTNMTPPADAEKVSKRTNVEATFSKEMNGATISATTFTLVKKAPRNPVAAKVTYDPANRKAILYPNTDLDGDTLYEATVKGQVKDVAGNPLEGNKGYRPSNNHHVWTFRTEV